MPDDDQGDLFEQTKIIASFEFTVLDGDLDPDMAAMWLSEDAEVSTALLREFSMGGVVFRREDTGHWVPGTPNQGGGS